MCLSSRTNRAEHHRRYRTRYHLAEMQHAQRKDPSQLDAWDHIMRAHWRIRRFTRDDLAEARRLLVQAIALDPANSIALAISPLPAVRGRLSMGGRTRQVACAARRGRPQGCRH